MHISGISLEGFRSFKEAEASFSEGINVLYGGNAQGKTTLLEAVHCLSSGRSFRTRSDGELIHFDFQQARIYAQFFARGRGQTLDMTLFRGRKKSLALNGVKLKRASELAGKLGCVLFCPEDLGLVRDGAAVRRKLMDLALCQMRPRYASALSEFGRLYEHKTRILRDFREKPSLLETLDDFSRRMAQKSAELICYRARFVKKLGEAAGRVHWDFSGGCERLEIRYKTLGTIENPLLKPAELYPLVLEHQEKHRETELRTGLCLSGAHKDDLEIGINGNPARSYASQGQARTAALSIKLAERELYFEDSGEYPVLLLDDVLSELDEKRRAFVLGRIGGGQVFITCCESGGLDAVTGGRLFKIDDGKIWASG